MTIVLVFVVSLFLLLSIFGLLAILKRPVYRLTASNVKRLLELVLAGEATEDDWNVFIEMPIRYDDRLEEVRLRSAEITDDSSEYSKPGFLFSDAQLMQIKDLLENLEKDDLS